MRMEHLKQIWQLDQSSTDSLWKLFFVSGVSLTDIDDSRRQ